MTHLNKTEQDYRQKVAIFTEIKILHTQKWREVFIGFQKSLTQLSSFFNEQK